MEKMIGELTANEAYDALINNSLDWYIVEYVDGSCDLKHHTSLSSILECGVNPAQWDIAKFHQCWNFDELGKCPFDGFDPDVWEENHGN